MTSNQIILIEVEMLKTKHILKQIQRFKSMNNN